MEIVGARLMSPFFGDNVFVWSALISVTLAALAVGYWLGGQTADRRGTPALLDLVVAVAGVFIAVMPPMARVAGEPLSLLNYQSGILITALISFGPSLFLIGTVTPIAVRLIVGDLDHVGRHSGVIYAWSTAGGILGAILTGFVLLPSFSATQICYTTALGMLLLSAVRWLRRTRQPAAMAAIVLILLAELFLFRSGPRDTPWQSGPVTVRSDRRSSYGTVRVLEVGGWRMLAIDGLCHNAQTIEGRDAVFPHVQLFAALPYLKPGSRKALLIGLGGGDMVRLLNSFGIRTTAVEIDPVVAEAAFEHFGLERGELDVFLEDGRRFLRRSPAELFDFVILDAYSGASPPYHLFSREAFEEMKERLKPGGILAVNLVVSGRRNALADGVAATLRSTFQSLLVVATEQNADGLCNTLLFASDQELRLPAGWIPAPVDTTLGPTLEAMRRLVLDYPADSGQIITDARNPVERQSAATEIALRRSSRQHLPAAVLAP